MNHYIAGISVIKGTKTRKDETKQKRHEKQTFFVSLKPKPSRYKNNFE